VEFSTCGITSVLKQFWVLNLGTGDVQPAPGEEFCCVRHRALRLGDREWLMTEDGRGWRPTG
jgi:hypothetical protein